MIITDIKKQIYDCLSGLEAHYPVIQSSDNVFSELPTITYFIENNYKTDHDGEAFGKINLVVDIWSGDSVQVYTILQEITVALKGIGYEMSSSTDVPNEDKTIYHLNSQFATIL